MHYFIVLFGSFGTGWGDQGFVGVPIDAIHNAPGGDGYGACGMYTVRHTKLLNLHTKHPLNPPKTPTTPNTLKTQKNLKAPVGCPRCAAFVAVCCI